MGRQTCPHGSKRRAAALFGAWLTLLCLALLQVGRRRRCRRPWPTLASHRPSSHLLPVADLSDRLACMQGCGIWGLPHGKQPRQAPASGLTPPKMPAVGSGRGGASGSDTGRLSSRVTCARKRSDVAYITPREVDLQQQRHCALKETGGHPPGGYLAICTTVRSECVMILAGFARIAACVRCRAGAGCWLLCCSERQQASGPIPR